MCEGLLEAIDNFDYFHIVSGDGYLAMMEMIPKSKTAHLYLSRHPQQDSFLMKEVGVYGWPVSSEGNFT